MQTEPGLHQLQTWMASVLLEPERLEDPRERALLAARTSMPGRFEPIGGLRVYAGGYPARLREALLESFEGVASVVGDDVFAALVMRYVRACPPTSYNLNHAGAAMAQFLRRDPLTAAHPFLPDLAELEWRITEAFHAPAHPPFDPAATATWNESDWNEAVLVFQPAVALVSSRWPVLTLWRARKDEDRDATGWRTADEAPEHVLVFRHDLDIRLDSIDPDQATVLKLLLARRSLGHVVDALASESIDETSLAEWFSRWSARGLIVACTRREA